MEEADRSRTRVNWLGCVFLWLGGASALVLGNILSIGLYGSRPLAAGFAAGISGQIGLKVGLIPSMALIVLGALLV